jgi:hypothetical protein
MQCPTCVLDSTLRQSAQAQPLQNVPLAKQSQYSLRHWLFLQWQVRSGLAAAAAKAETAGTALGQALGSGQLRLVYKLRGTADEKQQKECYSSTRGSGTQVPCIAAQYLYDYRVHD